MDAHTDPSSGSALRVLLIEDSQSDAELAMWRLKQAGYTCTFRCVVNEVEMRAALRAELPDLILSDFSLPAFDGMSALAIARAEAPGVPFIFLSGTIGEERAIEALKCGAIDYVLQMLSGINSALVRIQNRDEVMAETCRLAHGVGGYTIAMLALINPTTRMARPVGWAGYEFLPRPEQEFPVADHQAGDTSLMGRVIRTGEAVLCPDLVSFPHVIHGRDKLIAAGVRSLACLPLRVDNTPVGSFLCGTGGSTVIGQDELLLLEEVAANLSFALQYLDKQDALHFLSYFEPLTGLAKRALFCERLSRLLMRGTGSLPRLEVTVFDITHLSVINDSFGRHTGDRLLQCVADRLQAQLPDTA